MYYEGGMIRAGEMLIDGSPDKAFRVGSSRNRKWDRNVVGSLWVRMPCVTQRGVRRPGGG